MLYAILAACATLVFVLALAVSHAAKAHRLARLFRAQQEWADPIDRHDSPAETTPSRSGLQLESLDIVLAAMLITV